MTQPRDAAPAARNYGRWHYTYATEQWYIEPDLLVLFDSGSDDPHDLEVLVGRVFDEERERLVAMIDQALATRGSLAGQFRMRTVSRGEAVFALVGDTFFDDAGEPVQLRGYSTDVTEEVRHATRAAVDAATRHRRAIEQVKGALMVTYRIDEVTAFALMRQQSNAHNVKLNVLCEHVSRALGSGPRDRPVPLMDLIDGVARTLRELPA